MEIYIGSIGERVDVECHLRDKELVVIDKVSKDGKDLCLHTLKALGLLDEIITNIDEGR